MSTGSEPVTIVGAGIAGAACAVVLRDADIPFRLVERGRSVGGRMASPELHGRRVDIGAGYFTVRDRAFTDVVGRWEDAGLARRWTDTFGVLSPGNSPTSSTGPMRWATPGGLRSLVRELLGDIGVDSEEITTVPDGDVVLAMPDPQANRLTPVPDPVGYDPVLTVVLGFDSLTLPFENAAFVNDHPVLEFLADDGARRGDGASVLVAHTTASLAREYLDHPDDAVAPVIDAVTEVIGSTPSWTHVHRWTFAKPVSAHASTFGCVQNRSSTLYFAGDQWSPGGPPRIESAWRSGSDAGRAVVDRRRR
ncbi:NAD(P)/FAD-dependent oxidoreductase [Rhodococcoides yunnanense]|uniref:NAD(P)/FAD-dependent oxidoreductase n=1 Tax=Rhodococcoides yunnanense TaxID=278209 RepID=UPI00093253D8|nr:NAD(P)-binding protein [Rhodococcus yunnanensis]